MNVFDYLHWRDTQQLERVSELKKLLLESLANERQIMATQAELAQQLTEIAAQAEKARVEIVAAIGALSARVDELEDALNNAGTVSPEVEAALAEVKAAVQTLDELNPDTTP